MRRRLIHSLPFARSVLVGFTVLVACGFGCGGGGLSGCGGSTALPKEPGPWGFPMDQAIEGGLQARITKPGFNKITSLIVPLAKDSLLKPQCLASQTLVNLGNFAKVTICES